MTTQLKQSLMSLLTELRDIPEYHYKATQMLGQLVTEPVSDIISDESAGSIIHQVTGIDVPTIMSGARQRPVADAGKLMVMLLRNKGMRWTKIGRMMGCDHATIMCRHKAGMQLVETDNGFAELWRRVLELHESKK